MNLIVTTKSGKIKGHMDQGLVKFLGIPYAKPPVGELRFKRARTIEPWNGVLEADAYGDVALQFDNEKLQGSENCLTLNVVRPPEGENLPVFVWIHGGGYMTGCASDPLYHGDSFARDGILYVSIQYRLNVLGVFDFTTYKGCEDFETNCALSDMVAAIRWIKENVAAFGGDPDRITIGGESAGAAAVVALLAVPAVRGCFSQAIAESALPNCVITPELSRQNSDLFIEGMGWTEGDLHRLRTDDPMTFIRGQQYVSARHQYKNPGIFLPSPVIDDLLPERPIDAIRAGSSAGVRLIIGTNLHEGTMFVHPENTGFPNDWPMVREMFERNGHGDHYARIRKYYDDPALEAKYGTPFVHLATDYAFEMPSVKVAEGQSRYADVYMYRFEFLPESAVESGMFVSHAFELPCVFAVKEHEFSEVFFKGELEETQDQIIDDIHRPWVRFIKAGRPDDGEWSKFTGACSPVRIFDRQTRTEVLDRTAMMDVWGDLRFYEGRLV